MMDPGSRSGGGIAGEGLSAKVILNNQGLDDFETLLAQWNCRQLQSLSQLLTPIYSSPV